VDQEVIGNICRMFSREAFSNYFSVAGYELN